MTTSTIRNRWTIALMVGVAIAISYLDRQTLPGVISHIQSDIPIESSTLTINWSRELAAAATAHRWPVLPKRWG